MGLPKLKLNLLLEKIWPQINLIEQNRRGVGGEVKGCEGEEFSDRQTP